MIEPRNPWLFRRLERLFGEVKIVHAGLELTGTFLESGGRTRFHPSEAGETYAVNCPFGS